MQRRMLKSKIHGATVSDAEVAYEGSVTIDADLMDAADLAEFEEVAIWDLSTGARLTTYVIAGPRGLGTVTINGAAAHLVKRGDAVIVSSFATLDEQELADFAARKVFVDGRNRIIRTVLAGPCDGAGAEDGAAGAEVC